MADRLARGLGVAVVAAPFAVGAALAAYGDDGGRDGQEIWRFADPEIVESSGLVATDDRVLTVNDSGDEGRVFVVDRASGESVGVTRWAAQPEDVEALAPAGPGEVWVADIGDNRATRDEVSLTRVPVGDGERDVTADASGATLTVTYPDGARDAEALVAHPGTGRLFVITKGVLAGQVLAVPEQARPGERTRLREVAAAPGLVTDAAFWPDGDHLLVRTYSRAVVLSYPSFEPVGSFDLPEQPQGEGVAIAPDGAVLLSSEGLGEPLLRVSVPASVRRAMQGGATSTAPDGERDRDPARAGDVAGEESPARPDDWVWWAGAAGALVLLALLIRLSRPRS